MLVKNNFLVAARRAFDEPSAVVIKFYLLALTCSGSQNDLAHVRFVEGGSSCGLRFRIYRTGQP